MIRSSNCTLISSPTSLQIIILALIAVALTAAERDDNENTQYDYSYSVEDQNTGDIKNHQEVNRNGNVRGQYSLIDADGYHRIVDYKADDRNGFNSEVRRDPIYVHRENVRSEIHHPLTTLLTPLYRINHLVVPTSFSTVSRIDGVRSDYHQQLARHQQDLENQMRQIEQHNLQNGVTPRQDRPQQYNTNQNEQERSHEEALISHQGHYSDTTVNAVRRLQQNQMENAANYHEETIHNVLKSQQQQHAIEQHEQEQQKRNTRHYGAL